MAAHESHLGSLKTKSQCSDLNTRAYVSYGSHAVQAKPDAKKPKAREGSEWGKECQWEDLAQGESPRPRACSFGREVRAECTDLSIGREGFKERPRIGDGNNYWGRTEREEINLKMRAVTFEAGSG